MLALALHWHTVISRNLAAWAWRLEWKLADSALLLLGGDVPHPRCNRVPAENFELHSEIQTSVLIIIGGDCSG